MPVDSKHFETLQLHAGYVAYSNRNNKPPPRPS